MHPAEIKVKSLKRIVRRFRSFFEKIAGPVREISFGLWAGMRSTQWEVESAQVLALDFPYSAPFFHTFVREKNTMPGPALFLL
ncbi:hypothetical protein LJC24_02775 [Desulfococcaceae bacterium OttesenSCG-928-F15]|nr:hypothetical protein [Desulfococcaceae bacterium OttesenSCG-928-F15]